MTPEATLYIHLPFCRSKCAYCDFYSAPAKGGYEAYIDALLTEWRLRRGETGADPQTIYLGGGTPSLIPLPLLRRLLDGLGLDVKGMMEVTIEANPEDVTPEWLDALRDAGVSRISIGVQSFSEEELAAVSRKHSAEDAIRALETLRDRGWNYSADLIYGLPGQSVDSWRQSLEQMMEYRPPHLSAYLLSYEPGTPLYAQLMKGAVTEADEEIAEEMYNILCQTARDNGYTHYEISNFAQPGRRAVHNSAYWTGTPYLGLGAAAHSCDKSGVRRFNAPSIKGYVNALKEGRIFCQVDEETAENRANDMIITALRTCEGLDVNRLPCGADEVIKSAGELARKGMIEADGSIIRIPERNWLASDAIMRELLL